MTQAQAAASQGDLEQARTLALEANELNVAYDLFDLRPEQVLAQVERVSNNQRIAKGSSKAKPSAKVPMGSTRSADKAKTATRHLPATNKVQPTSAKQGMLPTLEFDDSPFDDSSNPPRENGVIFVPPAPESEGAIPATSEPAVDEVSAMPPQRDFGDALLVPSASDDVDDDNEGSSEFWDK